MIFESGMHFDFEKAKAGFPGACPMAFVGNLAAGLADRSWVPKPV